MSSRSQTYRQPRHALGARVRPRRASLLLEGESGVHAVALREGVTLVVGRAEPSDVVLDDASLSRRHASIRWDESGLHIEDLGSTNGVWVNQERVRSTALVSGQEVLLGSVALRAVIATPGSLPDVRASDSDAFGTSVSAEIMRAHALSRSCTVLAVRTTQDGLAWMENLRGALSPVDVAHQVGPRCALLLLAEVGVDQVEQRSRILGAAIGNLPLSVGSGTYPEDGTTADALIRVAFRRLQRGAVPGREATSGTMPVVRTNGTHAHAMVVESEAMRRVMTMVDRVAKAPLPVLVTGESGVGKAMVAQAIHERSDRSRGRFTTFRCAMIAPNLLDVALFGRAPENGALGCAGALEKTEGGTLFIDEVSDLSLQSQALLLEAIETGRARRVGGQSSVECDVRVIVATRRDLESLVLSGDFREDLLYRLDAFSLEIPPLRQRSDEIASLARIFLAHARIDWHANVSDLDEHAIDAIRTFAWPGNVRQLKTTIERASVVATGDLITLEDLPREVSTSVYRRHPQLVEDMNATVESLVDRVDAYERELIRDALTKCGGNQTKAARLLRIPRRTLAHKVKRHGLA